jgi:hypothetical protein
MLAPVLAQQAGLDDSAQVTDLVSLGSSRMTGL